MAPKTLEAKKAQLYSKCAGEKSGTVFSQDDLVNFKVSKDLDDLVIICQELVNSRLFQIVTLGDGQVCYRIRNEKDAKKSASKHLTWSKVIANTILQSQTYKPKRQRESRLLPHRILFDIWNLDQNSQSKNQSTPNHHHTMSQDARIAQVHQANQVGAVSRTKDLHAV